MQSASRVNRLFAGAGSIAVLVACSILYPGRSMAQTARPSGSKATPLTVEAIYGKPGLGGRLANAISWTPDGKQVGFIETTGSEKDAKRELELIDVATGTRTVLRNTSKRARE